MIIPSSVIDAAESRQPYRVTALRAKAADIAVEALALPIDRPISAKTIDSAMAKRTANLTFAGAKPSTTEYERLLGNNDLVDEFYLERALVAARPVMRIILRDASGSERGWATGFMVSPRLLLTNWHVFPTQADSSNAIAEAHYVLDIAGNPAPSYRFAIRGDVFYFSDQALDVSLVAVEQVTQDGHTSLSQFGYHALLAEPNKIRENESITLIQHPGGERRQFAIRENELIKTLDDFLWYRSDTAPGSSGAPAFNDSFQVVALHHSGAAKRDDQGRYVLRDGSVVATLADVDESQIVWVANEGVRISVLCAFLRANLKPDNSLVSGLFEAMQSGGVMSAQITSYLPEALPSGLQAAASPNSSANNLLTIPLQLQISLSLATGMGAPASRPGTVDKATDPTAPVGVEVLKYPIVDRDYTSRTGYQTDFLGVPAPLPEVTDLTLVSRMVDGRYTIPYEHFSVVLNRQRRLPLFTASNADYSLSKRRPEPGDYSRTALTGLVGPYDREKWLTDPRIPQQDQLPDIFYNEKGNLFDKGHVTSREDVCWGDSRNQIVRANGDTYHVTNCTPQVHGFNRSQDGQDNWGDLENEIKKQAKTERLSILAGPILADDDRIFKGRDDFGKVMIKIPREFWKVVLANDRGQLAAYAFILQQDLHRMPEEFRVTATWQPFLVSLKALEKRLSGFRFPPEIHAADRAETGGLELAKAIGVEIHSSLSATTTGAGNSSTTTPSP